MKKMLLPLLAFSILLSSCAAPQNGEELSMDDMVATAVIEIQNDAEQIEQPASQQEQISQETSEQDPAQSIQPGAGTSAGIPGLPSINLIFQIEEYGFQCVEPEWSDDKVVWRCDFSTDEYQYFVTVWGSTTENVDLVEAAAFYFDEQTDYSDLTAILFAQIAAAASPVEISEQASAWVQQSIPQMQTAGDEAVTSFANVRYYIYALPSTQVLEIGSL